MNEEQLRQVTFTGNLTLTKPEEAQHLMNGDCGHAQVCEGQQAEQQEHGLMQGSLCGDGEEDGAVSQHSDDVNGGEGDRDPSVFVFHSWDSLEDEE